MHLPLTAIDPAGGMVPQTDVVIQRKGPVLIWARAPDGSSYTTTQKGHAQALGRQEAHACQVRQDLTKARLTNTICAVGDAGFFVDMFVV